MSRTFFILERFPVTLVRLGFFGFELFYLLEEIIARTFSLKIKRKHWQRLARAGRQRIVGTYWKNIPAPDIVGTAINKYLIAISAGRSIDVEFNYAAVHCLVQPAGHKSRVPRYAYVCPTMCQCPYFKLALVRL